VGALHRAQGRQWGTLMAQLDWIRSYIATVWAVRRASPHGRQEQGV